MKDKKLLDKQYEEWNKYKKSLDSIPSYLILQKASDFVLDYSHTKRPTVISWFDRTDDFIILWQKLEQMSNDLDKLATIDKALHTIRKMDKEKLGK